MGDEQNNPFNDAAFAKNYRATADAFRSIAGNGETNEGIMEDIANARTLGDGQALKDSIDSMDGQIQSCIKLWTQFKSHLQSKL